MRIAVPMAAGEFSAHFGQSHAFWVCDVTEDPATITNGRELAVSGEGGCGSIPPMLAAEGVKLVIAGGMGAGAVARLAQFGIKVILGVDGGAPRDVVEQYLAGALAASGQVCAEHDHHHNHHHHHAHGGHCHHEEKQ